MSANVPPLDGVLEAELLRNVLDTVTHDLGGLSSALALRADVMQRAQPGASATAFSTIAIELRSLGGQLRELSGPRGGATLAPTSMGSLDEWFAVISRFGQPLLGRGVSFHGDVDHVHVGSVITHELTYVVLAVLHAIREVPESAHTEIRMSSIQREDGVVIRLGMHGVHGALDIADCSQSRWWQWATQRASDAAIGMRVVDAHVELSVTFEPGA